MLTRHKEANIENYVTDYIMFIYLAYLTNLF